MSITLGIWLDFNSRVEEWPDHFLTAWYWRLLSLIAAFALSCLAGYTRLVLGVHSLDQVLFGLMLGAWFALTAHFLIRIPLIVLVGYLIEGKETRLKQITLVATCLYLIIIGI